MSVPVFTDFFHNWVYHTSPPCSSSSGEQISGQAYPAFSTTWRAMVRLCSQIAYDTGLNVYARIHAPNISTLLGKAAIRIRQRRLKRGVLFAISLFQSVPPDCLLDGLAPLEKVLDFRLREGACNLAL